MAEGVEIAMPVRAYGSGCVGTPSGIDGWVAETGQQEMSTDEVRDDVPAEIKAYYTVVFGHPSERWFSEEGYERSVKTWTDRRTESLNRPLALITIEREILDKCDADQSSSDQEPVSPRTFSAGRYCDGAGARGTYCGNASLEQWRAAYDLRRTAEDVLIPWFIFYDRPLPWVPPPGPEMMPLPLRIRKTQSSGAVLYSQALRPQRNSSRPESDEQVPSLISKSTSSPHSCNHGPSPLTDVGGWEHSTTALQPQKNRISSWMKRMKSRVIGGRRVPPSTGVHAGSGLSMADQRPREASRHSVVKTMRKRFSSLRDIRGHFAKFRRPDAPVVGDGTDGILRDESASQLSESGAEPVSAAALSSALRSLQDEMERGRSLTRSHEAMEYEWIALTPSSFDESMAETETYASEEAVVLPLRVVNL
nr:hypothetical protein CFP56_01261 [Quercus suber]